MIQALQLALSVLKHIQQTEHPYHRATLPGELEMAIEQIQLALERGWQGLTDEEIVGASCECVDDGTFNMNCAVDFARAIEAKLKERNK